MNALASIFAVRRWEANLRRRRRALIGAVSVLLAAVLGACGGSGGGASGVGPRGDADLVAVHYGRLADVYGLRERDGVVTVELHRRDVLVGLDIRDERKGGDALGDDEILYDFLSPDPDTLQLRLLITRRIGSEAFRAAFDALDAHVRRVQPLRFGQKGRTFTAVPRNAALRLTFSRDLGIDDSFFVEKDSSGAVTAVKNTEAVQLLQIVGDPTDGKPDGDFRVIPTRVHVDGNRMIVDPVLLGSEGLRHQVRNNAAGMPEAPDQKGANIRLALALEGPLAIPGLREDRDPSLLGRNNAGRLSVIRDFRSGNRNDESPDSSRGFLRDPIPPRIVGHIVFYLERVERRDASTQVLTLFKGGVRHEIDRGDVLRIAGFDNKAAPLATTEVLVDPRDDAGKPEVQHVRVIVRAAPGLEAIDPWRRIPADLRRPGSIRDRERWLVANANRAVLVCEYTGERQDGRPADDPRYFITFSPAPFPLADGSPSPANENISPFAGANIRFSKPVDMARVKALDTFFFATRDLFDPEELQRFLDARGIDPASFVHAKYVTPHLVAARIYDEDGSQTVLRLQPQLGFYLDDRMRKADEGKPFEDRRYKYYLHLLGGKDGIRDLSGNEIDFQVTTSAARDYLVIPFTLDLRRQRNGQPVFGDNLVVTVARRFAHPDEDEQPSYYMPDEVQKRGAPTNPAAFNLEDLFGPVRIEKDGSLAARPTSRTSKMVDDLAQIKPPPQSSPLRWCPPGWQASWTTRTPFNSPLQNPLNPYGCRLQTVWREIDFSLSRIDPNDFNLDVEQMYWCPFRSSTIYYDEFDRMAISLGHSEYRPVICRQGWQHKQQSGLDPRFADNYLRDKGLDGKIIPGPAPHPAYKGTKNLVIDPALVVNRSTYRYLPLPRFEEPFFVWRDETVMSQGGNSRDGGDVKARRRHPPYLLSPFLGGKGRFVKLDRQGKPTFDYGYWNSAQNWKLTQSAFRDPWTDGGVGTIALPLLADFQVHPDSPDLPEGYGFIAWGGNGWQISLPVVGWATPNFRVYSAGGIVRGKPFRRGPSSPEWHFAAGGFTPNGTPTRTGDNSVFWVMADFMKRTTVATAGFLEILNPHRMPAATIDPRLGPYLGGKQLPQGVRPRYAFAFEPSLDQLPGGTSVRVEFRGAGAVDPKPWRAEQEGYDPAPNAKNFPLDPRKAGDAHIRKYDDRDSREAWTYFYNRNVTDYVSDPNRLNDVRFTQRFAGPKESFLPRDVRYLNWRFVMRNNVAATPPVSPRIRSFLLTYRFEKVR